MLPKKESITQVILVKLNEIPFIKLINPKYLEMLRKIYKFGGGELLQGASEGTIAIHFNNGFFIFDDREISIEKLTIETRKIMFGLEGSSKVARRFFEELRSFFAELDDNTDDSFMESVVLSEESSVITHLDFPIERLLSPAFLMFMESEVNKVASIDDTVEAKVKPGMINFEVNYLPIDFSLSDYRIALSRKDFTIGPAVGYPLSDQLYYSKAPFDSSTHLKLLIELERIMK